MERRVSVEAGVMEVVCVARAVLKGVEGAVGRVARGGRWVRRGERCGRERGRRKGGVGRKAGIFGDGWGGDWKGDGVDGDGDWEYVR